MIHPPGCKKEGNLGSLKKSFPSMILRGNFSRGTMAKGGRPQDDLTKGYARYETTFEELWGLYIAAPSMPDFFKMDKFLTGLCEPLREKMREKSPTTYEKAITIAQRKKKKL